MTNATRLRLWGPVAAYLAVIFYLSSLPDPSLPAGTTDKSWHAVGYMGLAMLICRALAGGLGRLVTPRVAVIAMAVAIGYGVSDELHQALVPGRSPDVNDLVADTIGACAGTAASWAWGIISATIRHERR